MNELTILLLLAASVQAASVQKADSLIAARQTAISPAELIAGRVSGVMVTPTDGSAEGALVTNVRGVGSVRGTSFSQPLWIVDGAMLCDPQYCNSDKFPGITGAPSAGSFDDLYFLSAYQIESIEVLKDVSATASYGPLGANGVVLVNTLFSSGSDFSVHSNFTVGESAGHNHSLLYSQSMGRTRYSLGAFFRNTSTSGDHGGFRARFETGAGDLVNFGFNTSFTLGKASGPVQDALDENFAKRWRSVSSAFLDVRLSPWLKWHSVAGADYACSTRYLWYDSGTEFGRLSDGAASIDWCRRLGGNLDTRLQAGAYMGARHRVDADLGLSLRYTAGDFSLQCDTAFVSHSLGARGIELAGSVDVPQRTSVESLQHSLSGGVHYCLGGTLRLDASAALSHTSGYDADGQYVVYPSLGASIDLRRLLFPSSGAVSLLSLRGGWGRAGREYPVPTQDWYAFTSVRRPDLKRSEMAYYEAIERLTTSECSAGFDLGLAGGRLSLSAGWYDRRTDDALTLCGKSYSDGSRTPVLSTVAGLCNSGLEADLSAGIVRSRDFSLTLTADGAYNVNVVTDIPYEEQTGGDVSMVAGRSVSVFCGYEADPLTGGPLDRTGDGVVSEADKVVLGNSVPAFYGGLGLDIRWKSLRLEALMDGAAGFDAVDVDAMTADDVSDLTSSYVRRADFVRLRTLALSWRLTPGGLNGGALTFELSARNIVTLGARQAVPYFRTLTAGVALEF